MSLSLSDVKIKSVDEKAKEERDNAVLADIGKIDSVSRGTGLAELQAIHRYLDCKYQACIVDWGQSMYCYNKDFGFDYNSLDADSLIDNMISMKAKLEAFIMGWNEIKEPFTPSSASDVNVTVNNNLNINITFEEVRNQIEEMTSLTEEQTEDILKKIDEIETVTKENGSKKSKWEKIKPVLAWLADKSFDVAMTILPLLLQFQK